VSKIGKQLTASGNRTKRSKPSVLVLTIGHSTRTIEQFIHLVQAHEVKCLVDVRTVPRSRHNPQFSQDALRRSLEQTGIDYVHMAGLGGLRHTTKSSPNTGWRNSSFRGFADYMQSPEFERALEELVQLTEDGRVALMCAEAVPWRCHRSLIADALLVRGFRTEHILSASSRQIHALTPFAKVRGTSITYPAAASQGTLPIGLQSGGVKGKGIL
jgi:uncharacterized protein (DUF488 family)